MIKSRTNELITRIQIKKDLAEYNECRAQLMFTCSYKREQERTYFYEVWMSISGIGFLKTRIVEIFVHTKW